MKFKSQVLTQASGSIGGITYSHNRGGLYTRSRSIPVNQNTPAQQAVRTSFSSLVTRWSQVLTQAQRDAWSSYAALTPVTNVFGDPFLLSGQQMYVRCNSVRMRALLAAVDDGPVTPGLADLSPVGALASIATIQLGVTFSGSDPWVSDDFGGLAIQTSRFLSPAVNFFRSPFRFLATVLGNNGSPPATPEAIGANNAFAQPLLSAVIGQRIFYRVTAFDGEGRLSPVQIVSTQVTA